MLKKEMLDSLKLVRPGVAFEILRAKILHSIKFSRNIQAGVFKNTVGLIDLEKIQVLSKSANSSTRAWLESLKWWISADRIFRLRNASF